MVVIGDTIRIKATFKDWAGRDIDPDEPRFRAYNMDDKQTPVVDYDLQSQNRVGVGIFEIDYTVPDGNGFLVLEISGMVGGMPQVTRVCVERCWVEPRKG